MASSELRASERIKMQMQESYDQDKAMIQTVKIEGKASGSQYGSQSGSWSMKQTRILGDVEHVGLGLRLERSSKSPDVYIQEIVPGFAAQENGRLMLDDVVVAVDHIPLVDMELEAIKQLTIGEEGTFCTLQIQRGDHYFQVTLMRKFPDRVTGQNMEVNDDILDVLVML